MQQRGAVNVAISNERLTRFGLVSMMDTTPKGVLLVKLIEPAVYGTMRTGDVRKSENLFNFPSHS